MSKSHIHRVCFLIISFITIFPTAQVSRVEIFPILRITMFFYWYIGCNWPLGYLNALYSLSPKIPLTLEKVGWVYTKHFKILWYISSLKTRSSIFMLFVCL